MQSVRAGKARLVSLGTWLAQDPRRLTAIFTVITVLTAVVALTTGLALPATLIGPSSDGGGGGG